MAAAADRMRQQRPQHQKRQARRDTRSAHDARHARRAGSATQSDTMDLTSNSPEGLGEPRGGPESFVGLGAHDGYCGVAASTASM